jgi:hypothetical protein
LLEAHCGGVFQNGFVGLVKNLPVDFPPVPDKGDIDPTALIVDFIDHSVITDSKPPQVFCTANLLTALGGKSTMVKNGHLWLGTFSKFKHMNHGGARCCTLTIV